MTEPNSDIHGRFYALSEIIFISVIPTEYSFPAALDETLSLTVTGDEWLAKLSSEIPNLTAADAKIALLGQFVLEDKYLIDLNSSDFERPTVSWIASAVVASASDIHIYTAGHLMMLISQCSATNRELNLPMMRRFDYWMRHQLVFSNSERPSSAHSDFWNLVNAGISDLYYAVLLSCVRTQAALRSTTPLLAVGSRMRTTLTS